jgi:hypothetical protein
MSEKEGKTIFTPAPPKTLSKSQTPPKPVKMTPESIRRQIGKLDNLEMNLQMKIPQLDMKKKNEAISLLMRVQNNRRTLYEVLHQMKERGELAREREDKLQKDWNEKKCPSCAQAKLTDQGICPVCGYGVKDTPEEKIDRLDTPFTYSSPNLFYSPAPAPIPEVKP